MGDFLGAMFEDCGGQLQRIAKINVVLSTIIGMVGGFFVPLLIDDFILIMLLGAILGGGVGFFCGWASSLSLCAFGVIVENVEKTRINLFLIREQVERIEKTVVTKTAAEE